MRQKIANQLRFNLLVILTGLSLWAANTFAGTEPLKYGAGDSFWFDDLRPITDQEWTYERAAHLLERAGFGGTPAEIEKLANMTPSAAVSYLVDYESVRNDDLSPFDESGIWDEAMLPDLNINFDFNEGVRRGRVNGEVYGVKPNEDGVRPMQPVINKLYYRTYASRHEWERATVWWAGLMLNTNRPLEERMTLFWHDHFAVEQEKLRDYRLMLDQIDVLRENATGNFRDMLIDMSKDPGMLVYLDNRLNVKGSPNENFAREIMELFALGVGNYTENDIKEAARALTGWTHHGQRYINDTSRHDDGEKTILGETGTFDGYDVVDILLRQEVCAEFIAGKLYKYFVREEMTPEMNKKIAAILRDNNYEIKPLMKALFLSRDFYSPASYGAQIKSPVVFLVSTYKKLGLDKVPGTPYLPYVSPALGQALGNPPNVAGWDGGRSWINPSTLIERGNIMRHLLFPHESEGLYDIGPFAGRYQRYVNAHQEVLKRDRDAILGPMAGTANRMNMEGGEESSMMAPSAALINETPQYDLPYGVYNGKSKAYENIKAPDQSPANFSLATTLSKEGVKTASDATVYLERLLLRVPVKDDIRAGMVQFLANKIGGHQIDYTNASTEIYLRELAHVIMSSPEFQLS
jgi:hypothetical protein